MSQLDQALTSLQSHAGVRHLLLLGHDGLLIRHLGQGALPEAETVAAMVPALANACQALGRASGSGGFTSVVVELEAAVAIVVSLSAELLLAVIVEPHVGFAPLLRAARQERARLAALL